MKDGGGYCSTVCAGQDAPCVLQGLDGVRTRFYHKGEYIFRSGQAHDKCGILAGGLAFAYRTTQSGRRQGLDFLFPGSSIGLQFGNCERAENSLVCLSDSVVCYLSPNDFSALLRNCPEIALTTIELVIEERDRLQEMLINVTGRAAREQVARLLDDLYRKNRRAGRSAYDAWLPISQVEISDALGLSLVHVNRVLSEFKASRCIATRRGQIRILDNERLAEI